MPDSPVLQLQQVNAYYGAAHALQDVSLCLDKGVFSVIGRNGMGKTTLCNAIVGMVASRGSIRFHGREIGGAPTHQLAHLGIGYVPQGRRLWPSLRVHEHLQLAASSARRGAWTIERVYAAFPRLRERQWNGGAQLSGGEQQMLAIARALLLNPSLLVMDEPTEGLAPVVVDQVVAMLKELADEAGLSILLIEQNIGVAMEVADSVGIMVNGRLERVVSAQTLAQDQALQQALLGLKSTSNAPGRPMHSHATCQTTPA